jgi:outer membrane protein|tara:strand:+ start:1136 stop:1789 length:654 start_codon:yes stop_codon:yes gene_type:complete
MQKISLITKTLLFILILLSGSIYAVEKGDWIIRAGYTNINPASNNGSIVDVDDKSNLTATFAYLITDNLGIEVLAGLPFEHEIFDKALGTGLKIASAKHLPPTITAQYYFNPNSKFRSYIGIGLNHTFFFKEETVGPLEGSSLDIGRSTDLVFQIGFDWALSDQIILNLDIRKFNIESKAKVTNIDNSSLKGILPNTFEFDVPIDPTTIGLSLVKEF